ncbi:hypothetical protein DKT75_17140 [Leucothrix arctica]|uniref:ABC transporter ATP-binding protein n=2 Tax=Leucothrix arctica TaxID=1481894 RepID=A0A317CB97_9GAMM|nr:hypothetical protein DKT75_17140 [Leucothrix arctica]
MLFTMLAIAGGTATVKYYVSKKKAKKTRRSLSRSIEKLNDKLQLDVLVPQRQSDHDEVQTHVALWKRDKPLVPEKQSAHSFKKEGKLFNRYLRKYGAPYWRPALLSGAGLVSFGLYEIGFTRALKNIINSSASGKGLLLAKPILAKLLLVFPAVALLVLMGERISAAITSKVVKDLNSDMYQHLQKLPVSYYKDTKLGDILTRFSSDMIYVRLGITQIIPTVADLLIVVLNIIMLFMLSVPMALVTMTSLPVLIYILRDFSPSLSKANYALKDEEAMVMQAVQESTQAQAMIKSFSIQPSMQSGFVNQLERLQKVSTNALFNRTAFERTVISSLFFTQLLSISTGLILLGAGTLSIGGLVSFIMMQGIFVSYMRKLFRNRIDEVLTSLIGIRRVDTLFQSQSDIIDIPGAIVLPTFREGVCFENVSFGYTDDNLQLRNTSFSIQPGSFVAFVGPSGAGKSTILNLLLRFYDVSAGRVTVDGHDIRHLTISSLRQKIGIVLQDTFVFNASIADNIRVAKPNATDDEIMQAAQAAELHEFITDLPQGYETNAGEAGKRLSGGQKQRVAIARAILCDPAILILDEATSSLDAETAAAIDATVHKLRHKCTVISISHNLRAIAKADNIFVLDKGSVMEQGSHDELMLLNGLYVQLWNAQTSTAHETPLLEAPLS